MTEDTKTENLTNNHVVAVINGDESARQTADALREAGFGDPTVLVGEEGANQIDARGETQGLLGKLTGVVQDHLSEATNFLAQYKQEVLNGRALISLEVHNREWAEPVKQILEEHGAYNIRFFGRLAVADLTPETNPSARSEDSPEVKREPDRGAA
jgi:hypothetical protein